jgi:hypothetical protein
MYRSLGSGLGLNNNKNRCQNFRKIFFSKKKLHGENENLGECSYKMENICGESSKIINYSAQSAKPNPGLWYYLDIVQMQYEFLKFYLYIPPTASPKV